MIHRKIVGASGLQVLANVSNLIFAVLIARWFGVSEEMDAYYAASAIVVFLTTLLNNAQAKAVIPMLSHAGSERAIRFSAVLFFNSLLFVVMASGVALFAEGILRLVAHGLSEMQIGVAASCLRILSIYVVMNNAMALFGSLLESEYRFELRYGFLVVQNLLMVAMLVWLRNERGVFGLVWIHTLSALFILLMMVVTGRKQLTLVYPSKAGPGLREYAGIAVPVLIASAFGLSMRLVETHVLSFQGSGAISEFNYGSRILRMAVAIASVAAAVFFPQMAKVFREGREEENLTLFNSNWQKMVLIQLVVTYFVLTQSGWGLTFFFQHGAFGPEHTRAVTMVIRWSALFLFIAPMGTFMVNAFIAKGLVRVSTTLTIVSSFIVGAAIWTGGTYNGVVGVAQGYSLGFLLSYALQWWFFLRHHGGLRNRILLGTMLRMLFALTGVLLLSWKLPAWGLAAIPGNKEQLIFWPLKLLLESGLFLGLILLTGFPQAKTVLRRASKWLSTARNTGR